MALTSRDETDLLLPLYQGAQESRRFGTFLERLKRRTGAEYIALSIRAEGVRNPHRTIFHAGRDLQNEASESGMTELPTLDFIEHDRLRLGRVYSAAEFIDHDQDFQDRRKATLGKLGIVDERTVRLIADSGVTAWLTLLRDKPCSAADSSLLSTLAPYVAAAIRNLSLVEQQRVELAMTSLGSMRTGTAWVAFDAAARVSAMAPQTAAWLAEQCGITARVGERLRDIEAAADKAMTQAAEAFSATPGHETSAIVLRHTPHVEALLLPPPDIAADTLVAPAMLGLIRSPCEQHSTTRTRTLAEIYDIPPREAELALALSDGLSIAEAANVMGLTVETARNYSKRLYAALDVPGQTQLVRKVLESVAIMA